jgi:DNA-binding HxlR family transcriptional regulator
MTPGSESGGMSDSTTEIDAAGELEVWCAGEEWCPITTTSSLIGKKWHPVIIHRLLEHGPSGFTELKENVDGISSKVLSDSLDDLGEKQLVEREIISEKPFRVEYSLTDHGRSLEPVIYAMRDWGLEHLTRPNDDNNSII